ncbi:MAG: hypothetical protein HC875_41025 [Anaerolineales bacterium]|nr:hypothetical protein [Anaerolineales bacterium]
MTDILIKRLTLGERETARKLFSMMAAVFNEDSFSLTTANGASNNRANELRWMSIT